MTQTNFELSIRLAKTRKILEEAAEEIVPTQTAEDLAEADMATVTNLTEYLGQKADAEEYLGALALLNEINSPEPPVYSLVSA